MAHCDTYSECLTVVHIVSMQEWLAVVHNIIINDSMQEWLIVIHIVSMLVQGMYHNEPFLHANCMHYNEPFLHANYTYHSEPFLQANYMYHSEPFLHANYIIG